MAPEEVTVCLFQGEAFPPTHLKENVKIIIIIVIKLSKLTFYLYHMDKNIKG